jgi:hypothetical protein
VVVAGVFHFDGWLPQTIDPNIEPPESLARLYEDVSPAGPDHYQVVVDRLARMHLDSPTFTVDDLEQVGSRTLVMVGDDDEVRLSTPLRCTAGSPTANRWSSREPLTGCSSKSRISAIARSCGS